MKKKSLMQRIINAATINPKGVTAAQIKNSVSNTPNAVSVALWKLKKDGVLTHDPKTGVYTLTGVNKSEAVATPVAPAATPKKRGRPAKPKAITVSVHSDLPAPKESKEVTNLKFQVSQLSLELKEMTERAARLNVQYEDALAVIRFLEDKLFKAIQFDARRGHA